MDIYDIIDNIYKLPLVYILIKMTLMKKYGFILYMI